MTTLKIKTKYGMVVVSFPNETEAAQAEVRLAEAGFEVVRK